MSPGQQEHLTGEAEGVRGRGLGVEMAAPGTSFASAVNNFNKSTSYPKYLFLHFFFKE